MVRNPLRDRPAQSEYNKITAHRQKLDQMTPHEILEHDGQVWEKTMRHGAGPAPAHKEDLLVNFFKVARHAGVYFRTAKVQGWTHYDKSVGALLSHGGRTLIQFPKLTHYDRNAHEFWDWFCGRSPIFKRQGTHSIKNFGEEYSIIAGDRCKYLKETGGIKHGGAQFVKAIGQFGSKMHHESSYGMHVALGGFGQVSEARGRVIDDKGTFGTIYLYYQPPTETTCGGVLIGCEGEGPDQWGEMGNYHSYNIGFIDKLRDNKPNKDMGLPTGPKWAAMDVPGPKDKDCLFIDLTGVGFKYLAGLTWDPMHARQPALPPRRLAYTAAPINVPTSDGALNDLLKRYNGIAPNHVQPRLDKLLAIRKHLEKKGEFPPLQNTVLGVIDGILAIRDRTG